MLLVGEVKLVRLYVNIAGKDVVKKNALDKGSLVIFLIVEGFHIAEEDREKLSHAAGVRIATLNEADAVILLIIDEAIGISVVDDRVGGEGKLLSYSLLGFSNLGKLAAGDDNTVLINNTDGTADNVLHLMKNCLIQAVRHVLSVLSLIKNLTIKQKSPIKAKLQKS
jgi:hypothetical protein